MTPNEILHKAMGFCPHLNADPIEFPYHHCLDCKELVEFSDRLLPDYSQPEHIGKVYAWMQLKPGKGFAPRWRDFNKWWFLRKHDSFKCLPFSDQIKVISEWITDEEKS